jgi:hypothetical protein
MNRLQLFLMMKLVGMLAGIVLLYQCSGAYVLAR